MKKAKTSLQTSSKLAPRLKRLTALLVASGCIAGPMPAVSQTVIIGDTGSEVITIPGDSLAPFTTLILGNTASGNGTLNWNTGPLVIGNGLTDQLVVGHNGVGTVNMTGGTVDILNGDINIGAFIVGNNAGSNGTFTQSGGLVNGGRSLTIGANGGAGTYNLNTGDAPILNVSILTLGFQGSGTFNQQAGTTVNTNNVFMGTDNATYNLSGGSLNVTGAQGTIVGTFNVADFNQSGGAHTTNELIIGNQSFARATYNLSSGTVTVSGDMLVGRGSADVDGGVAGLFRQTGGNVVTNTLWIGGDTRVPEERHYGRGRYELVDGTVTSQLTLVGNISPGSVLQTGGTFNAGQLIVGRSGSFTALGSTTETSTYDLQGGQLNTLGTTLGQFGMATLNQSGGEHNVNGNLVIGAETAFVAPFSPLVELGRVLQGIYNLASGTLNVIGDTILGAATDSKGTINQSGGVATLTGNTHIASGENSEGTYNLTGTGVLQINGDISVGRGGAGVFTQDGETSHTVTGALFLGGSGVGGETSTSRGTYNLVAGNLQTSATIVGQAAVGVFNQTGGIHQTGFLLLGNCGGCLGGNSNGTYNLSGGSLTASDMTVGGFGRGEFNLSGGNAAVGSTLVIGSGPAIGGVPPREGVVNLSGGILSVSGVTTVGFGNSFFALEPGGKGTFNQTGGIANLTGGLSVGGAGTISGGTGTYNLSGSGTLTTAFTYVGDGGTGVFNQSGGTHNTGSLVIGKNSESTGTYNLSGGVLNDSAIVGDAGVGVFNNTAGTHNVTDSIILGNQTGGNGTYNLSGTGQLVVTVGGGATAEIVVGRDGTGTFNQSGAATLTKADGLFVGGAGPGTVNLSGGVMDITGPNGVTYVSNGTVNQTGGSFSTNFLNIAISPGNSGTWNLDGGSFNVNGNLGVGGPGGGTGLLVQRAGSVASIGGDVYINGSSINGTGGTIRLDQGNMTVGGNVNAGNSGTGTLAISAGSLLINGGLRLGADMSAGVGNGVVNVSGTGQVVVNGAQGVVVGFVPGATGSLNVSGGSLTAPVITNNDKVNYSGGNITANVANNASFNVSGGAARTLTGNFSNNAGGTLTVAAASPLTISGVLTNAVSAVINAGANLIVGKDYNNLASGSGNAYDRRANVTGAGQIMAAGAGAATAQTVSGSIVGGTTSGNGTLNFGNVRVGQTVTQNYAIGNSNTGGPDLRGAVQTNVGGANVTDARLSGSGVTAGNWGPVAAGSSTGNLGVTFNATSAGALTGQKVGVINNFENTNSQLITLSGAAFNVAVGGATPTPVVVANQRVGGSLTQALTVTNSAAAGAFSEALNASFGGSTGQASGTGSVSNLIAGGSNASAMQVGVNTGSAGLKTGSVTLNYQTDGTGPNGNSGLAAIAAGSQLVNVSGSVFNMAVGSAAPAPIVFANRHVGDAATQTVTISNTAAAGGFSEALNASVSGSSGSVSHNNGSVTNLAAGASNSALNVSLNTSTAGARSGTVTTAYQSDGTGPNGNSGLAAIAAGSQTVNVSGNVYRLASANTISPVAFGNVHVGDVVSQALNISNTAVNDGFSEKLNASFGSVTDGRITTSGGINLLGAGQSNASNMVIGLNTASAGVLNGSARVLLTSDGAGTSGLGQTALTPQDVGVTADISISGSAFRLASASAATPNPVNFGNVRVGAVASQTLSITNTAINDGFSEKLNASIGGATAGVTSNGGAFTLLGPQATNNSALSVGLNTATAGAKSGSATITLVSDGLGTSNLGQTALGTQTVNISGGVYNAAVGNATPNPIVMNRRVGDVATQTLTISNTAAAGAFSEALNASVSGSSGAASGAGSLSNLIAGGSNNSAVNVSLNTATAGAKTGSVTVAYQTDGTGSNGNSGLSAISAGSQTINVSGNVYTTAIGQSNTGAINFGVVRVGDVVAARNVNVQNTAANTALNDTLQASMSGISGPFSNGGGVSGIGAGGSANMAVGLNTASAGVFSQNGSVGFVSQNAEMADVSAGANAPVLVTAQVNNYANASFSLVSSLGALTHVGTDWVLDLGNIALSAVKNGSIRLGNDVTGPADVLGGGFNFVDNNDFALSGWGPVSGLGAGQFSGDLSLSFAALALGSYQDIIDFDGFGTNASDTVGLGQHRRLFIRANVINDTVGTVPEPGTIALMLAALVGAALARRRRIMAH